MNEANQVGEILWIEVEDAVVTEDDSQQTRAHITFADGSTLDLVALVKTPLPKGLPRKPISAFDLWTLTDYS